MPKTKTNAIQTAFAEKCDGQPLYQAIDALLNLDIPAKGRIAHHIRTGRINHALSLCAAGQQLLWQKVWDRSGAAILDQLRLLARVEALLRSAMNNGKTESIGGTM